MEIFIRVSGKMEWLMVKAHFVTIKEVFMKANGLKTNSTVKEQNIGIITKSNTMEILTKVKKLEKVNLNVKEVLIMVTLWMDNSMVREPTILLIQGRYIKEALFKTNLTVKER